MTDAHSAADRDFAADSSSRSVPLHHPSDGPPPDAGEDLQCTRAVRAQATSALAFAAPPPDDDDPLLAFEPYIHAAPRRRSITPDVQRAFVAQLAATAMVRQAARHVGRSVEALYRLRRMPGAEGFAAAWDAALDRGIQRLEDCAMERAVHGAKVPIVSGGKLLGWYEKPDNGLLRFLLQHRLPTRYGAESPATLVPGHPTYDRIAREALEAEKKRIASYEYEDEILRSIDRKLENMRQRQIAIRAREKAEKSKEKAEQERDAPEAQADETLALPAPTGGPRIRSL